jgi:hypothetical protein
MQRYDAMKPNLKQSGSFFGIAGIAVMAFLYFFSGLIAPLWAVIVLNVIWLVHLVLGCKWFMTHPIRVLFLPVSLAVIWFGAIYAGEAFLDWTA